MRLWRLGRRCAVTRDTVATVPEPALYLSDPDSVDWESYIHDLVRLGTVHLDLEDLAGLTAGVQDRPGTGHAIARVLVSDATSRRAALEAQHPLSSRAFLDWCGVRRPAGGSSPGSLTAGNTAPAGATRGGAGAAPGEPHRFVSGRAGGRGAGAAARSRPRRAAPRHRGHRDERPMRRGGEGDGKFAPVSRCKRKARRRLGCAAARGRRRAADRCRRCRRPPLRPAPAARGRSHVLAQVRRLPVEADRSGRASGPGAGPGRGRVLPFDASSTSTSAASMPSSRRAAGPTRSSACASGEPGTRASSSHRRSWRSHVPGGGRDHHAGTTFSTECCGWPLSTSTGRITSPSLERFRSPAGLRPGHRPRRRKRRRPQACSHRRQIRNISR